MKTLLLAAAAAALLASCAASASRADEHVLSGPVAARADAAVNPAGDNCIVRVTPTREGARIEAVVLAARAFAGDYELTVTRRGAAGSSDIVQGGPFAAPAGSQLVVGSAELGADRHASTHAVLRLLDDGREVCRRTADF